MFVVGGWRFLSLCRRSSFCKPYPANRKLVSLNHCTLDPCLLFNVRFPLQSAFRCSHTAPCTASHLHCVICGSVCCAHPVPVCHESGVWKDFIRMPRSDRSKACLPLHSPRRSASLCSAGRVMREWSGGGGGRGVVQFGVCVRRVIYVGASACPCARMSLRMFLFESRTRTVSMYCNV